MLSGIPPCVFLAANHPEKVGVEETGFDAQRLATAFSDKLGFTQPAAIDVSGQQIIQLTTWQHYPQAQQISRNDC